MTKTTKYSLVVIAAVVLALVGGWIGAGMRGGNSASAASSNGDWIDKIKKSGELRVGVAIAPPMTVRENGKLGGPNLIPLENLAKELHVKIKPVAASWANIVAGLQAGRYDAAANLDTTVERAVSIQFSDPVYDYQGVFVVPAKSSYSTSESIMKSGKSVAIAQGSAPGEAVAAAGAKTLALADYSSTLQAMKAGRAIAEFVDLPTAESQAVADSSVKIVVPTPQIYAAGAGYGLSDTIDSRSLELINIAIADAQMSGELDRAYAKQHYTAITNLGSLEKK